MTLHMNDALQRLAAVHHIPYLHVHMAFHEFHTVMNKKLKHRFPHEDSFLITRPEVVLVTYMYGILPESLRLRGNLMYVLYALLTYYFCFWGVDFISLGVRKIGLLLGLGDLRGFEKLVVYFCVRYYGGLYGVANYYEPYRAWEKYLFTDSKRCLTYTFSSAAASHESF